MPVFLCSWSMVYNWITTRITEIHEIVVNVFVKYYNFEYVGLSNNSNSTYYSIVLITSTKLIQQS